MRIPKQWIALVALVMSFPAAEAGIQKVLVPLSDAIAVVPSKGPAAVVAAVCGHSAVWQESITQEHWDPRGRRAARLLRADRPIAITCRTGDRANAALVWRINPHEKIARAHRITDDTDALSAQELLAKQEDALRSGNGRTDPGTVRYAHVRELEDLAHTENSLRDIAQRGLSADLFITNPYFLRSGIYALVRTSTGERIVPISFLWKDGSGASPVRSEQAQEPVVIALSEMTAMKLPDRLRCIQTRDPAAEFLCVAIAHDQKMVIALAPLHGIGGLPGMDYADRKDDADGADGSDDSTLMEHRPPSRINHMHSMPPPEVRK